MTAIDQTDAPISGEQKHNSRRKSFVRYLVIALLAALVIGFGNGILVGMAVDGTLPAAVVVALVIIMAVGFIWFCFDYFKRIDELDLADNLWASVIGLYAYVMAFPSWTWLHDAGLVGPPDQWAIWVGTIAVATIAYLARKLGLR